MYYCSLSYCSPLTKQATVRADRAKDVGTTLFNCGALWVVVQRTQVVPLYSLAANCCLHLGYTDTAFVWSRFASPFSTLYRRGGNFKGAPLKFEFKSLLKKVYSIKNLIGKYDIHRCKLPM
jgi:hypothetical protein